MEMLKFYTKPNCPLCNEVRDILNESNLDWTEINILKDSNLFEKYRSEIPVVESEKGIWFYRDREKTPLYQWLENEPPRHKDTK